MATRPSSANILYHLAVADKQSAAAGTRDPISGHVTELGKNTKVGMNPEGPETKTVLATPSSKRPIQHWFLSCNAV
jgi:hypothetical protein